MRAIRIIGAAAVLATSCAGARAQTAADILNYKGADREQVLLEGARKEGQLVFYSSLTINQVLRPLADAFSKKYPFIKLNYWRAESANIFTKVAAEARAGNVVGDVVEGTGVGEVVVQAGLSQTFHTPMMDAVPARYHDKNGMWMPTRRSFYAAAYNTKNTPPEAAPKTYEDLLDPRWKGGKMYWHAGTSTGAGLFVSNLRIAWGEDKAMAYFKRLGEQKIVSMTSGSGRLLVDRVMAGEMPMALNIFAHHPIISAAKGAPVASALMDPIASTVGTMVIPKGLKHPYAAMLLVDFILSPEGQSILAGSDYFPVREDVAPVPALAPILAAVAKAHENFVDPETLARMTPSSEKIISEVLR
jgi:iron(III) transport system substrate-binding protein